MLLQAILSTYIGCHKIIWFKVMRFQILLYFQLFNGPLRIPPVKFNSAEQHRRVQYWSDLKSQVKLVMKCSIKKQLLQ